jgi:hypothetical protein
MPVRHAVRCPYLLPVSHAFDVDAVIVFVKPGHFPEFVPQGVGKMLVSEAGTDAFSPPALTTFHATNTAALMRRQLKVTVFFGAPQQRRLSTMEAAAQATLSPRGAGRRGGGFLFGAGEVPTAEHLAFGLTGGANGEGAIEFDFAGGCLGI